jgi:hypothetical protein
LRIGAAAVVVTILLIFFAPLPSAAQAEAAPQITASREIRVLIGGNVLLTDNYTITVPSGSGKIDSFVIGFPIGLGPKVQYADAISQSGTNLFTSRGPSPGNRSYEIRVQFQSPIEPSQTATLIVRVLLSDVITATQNFNLTVPRYPILAQNITNYVLRVIFPEDASFPSQPKNYTRTTFQGLPTQKLEASSVASNSSRLDSMAFSSQSMSLIRCDGFTRTITLQPPQTIMVTDQYRITNLAKQSLSTITLSLLNNSSDVYAEDSIGSITSDHDSGLVDVSPRITLQQNYSYAFTVHYRIPYERFVSKVSGASLSRLEIPVLPPSSNFSLSDVTVLVELPEGSRYESAQVMEGSELDLTANGRTIALHGFKVSTMKETLLRADYEYSILWAAYRPTLWILVATAVVGSILAFSRRKHLPAVRVTPVPLEILRAFTSKYDEKSSLSTELESLEKSMARGKVSRIEFRRRKTSIDARLTSLNREITQLKSQIAKAGGRFGSAIAKMEVAEAEIETARGELERVSSQYRGGRISRETFEKLREDYEKRIAKAQGNLDDCLAVLREELE